jgi:hypothetical protein
MEHYYNFDFKLIYTEEVRKYRVDPDMTITQFIEDIKNRIHHDFEVNDDEDIEIVEAGQFNNINSRDPELAPALAHSNYSVRQIYPTNDKCFTAFYIRKKQRLVNYTNEERFYRKDEFILPEEELSPEKESQDLYKIDVDEIYDEVIRVLQEKKVNEEYDERYLDELVGEEYL